ncbi:hypothetical protein WME99_51365 [Sorangium sp. So ce136]|uniref:hypothetical protein n=1 Tax=Sorangium sp. So ce136 TaxID=3133284 RepID=UPI003F10EE11
MPRSTSESMSPDAPVSLVVPFGAIGLVGGWLTADSFHLADEAPRYLLAGVTPVVAALLGSYLTRRIGGVGAGSAPVMSSAGAGRGDGAAWMDGPGRWTRQGPIAASLLALWAIGVAGVVNGMTIGLLLGPAGMIIGAAFGAVFSLPFVPALAAVLLAANRVGRARAGSIVAAADRRAVWAATSMVIALAVLTARALFGAPLAPELGRAVAAMGLATVGVLFVVDAVALARVLTLSRGPMAAGEGGEAGELEVEAEARDETGELGEGETGRGRSAARGGRGMGERIDLGLGEEVQVEVVRPTHAYRGTRQIARVVRGNRERAAAVLRAALARGGIALAIGAALWGEPWK